MIVLSSSPGCFVDIGEARVHILEIRDGRLLSSEDQDWQQTNRGLWEEVSLRRRP